MVPGGRALRTCSQQGRSSEMDVQGKTYAELDREDPGRATVMNGSVALRVLAREPLAA